MKKEQQLKKENFEKTKNEIFIKKEVSEVVSKNMTEYGNLVITGRSIPSVLDGLKPVQRRILYTFKWFNLIGKKNKSAKVVGNTIGSFHPHGDSSVYQAMIEMSVPFKNKFPLFNRQGNFGSIDNDSARAMRYTEIELPTDSSDLLFENINKKNVVTWEPNYDNSILEPKILPTKYPLHLLNGSTGIGYSDITTKIPSYNIKEMTNLFIYLIDNKFFNEKKFNLEDHKKNILEIVKTVDLPTGCSIYFEEENKVEDTIFKGNFSFRMRATRKIDEENNQIIFTNIPIDTNCETIREEIKKRGISFKLVKNKEFPKNSLEILNISENASVIPYSTYGIKNYDNDAEMILTFKKNVNLNNELIKAYKYTSLDSQYSSKLTVIDEFGRAVTLSFFEQIVKFLQFRCHIIYQSFLDDIEKLEKQLHLLKGFLLILSDLDEFIRIVTKENEDKIIPLLKAKFNLDEIQIEYLLDLKVSKLKKTSILSIKEETKQKEKLLKEKKIIVSSKEKIYNVIKQEYEELLQTNKIKSKNNDRLTKIIKTNLKSTQEDLVTNKEVIVAFTEDGLISYIDRSRFKTKSVGSGLTSGIPNNKIKYKIKTIETCDLKDNLILISNFGRAFKIKVYNLSEQFKFIGNFIKLSKDEEIIFISKLDYNEKNYCILTQNGKYKNIHSSLITNITSLKGIKIFDLEEKDSVRSFIPFKNTEKEVLLSYTSSGRIIKFPISSISNINKRGKKMFERLTLKRGETLEKRFIFEETEETFLIAVSDKGKCKKTLTTDLRFKNKGGVPIEFFNNSSTNGKITCGEVMNSNKSLTIVSSNLNFVLLDTKKINFVQRQSKGSVNLLTLKENEICISSTQSSY